MTVQQQQLMECFNQLLGNGYMAPVDDGNVAEDLNGPNDDRDGEVRPGKVKGGPRVEPVDPIDLTGFKATAPTPPAAPPSALTALMGNRANAELADDKLPNEAWEFLREAYSKHDGQVWTPAGQAQDKGWTARKVEANLTLMVLGAMLTENEKKLMKRKPTAEP